MAVDTAAKRRSSASSRRMPWMRRFGIAPDGSIGQADRQQGPWVYSGILAESVVVSGPQIEFRMQEQRFEFAMQEQRFEFAIEP